MTSLAQFAVHGGVLDVARRAFPAAPQPWLDLSTGINPVPYPFGDIAAEAWTRLPDATALARLEQAAARRYAAPFGASAIAAPGTQAIIQHLPTLAGGGDVRVLAPAYGEYERVFRAAGARVRLAPTTDALGGADVAVVVNPNNPDGRQVAPGDLLALAGRVGMLIVDEAFADALSPENSLVPRLPLTRALVLRSFGKMYGLAGLRLGFAVAGPEQGEALRRLLGPWAVSGPAIVVGTRALADEHWLAASQARLRADGARLGFMLSRIGAAPVGNTLLFRLVSHPVAPDLFRALAEQGILTRPFSDRSDRLRFGLPGRDADWARLDAALHPFR